MKMPAAVLDREPALVAYRAVRRLGAGPLSDKWLVREGDTDRLAVLRVDQPLAAAAGLDRASEWRLLCYLAEHGFAAAPLHRGVDWLLTGYVPGISWAQAGAAATERLPRLARHLRALHGLPVATDIPALDLGAKLNRYARRIDQTWALLAAAEGTVLWNELRRGCLPSICHNDLVVGNIVEAGDRLALIDWEFAASGYAPFDLAVVAQEQHLADAQLALLLQAYRLPDEPDAPWLERFDDWRQLYRLTAKLWSGFMQVAGRR